MRSENRRQKTATPFSGEAESSEPSAGGAETKMKHCCDDMRHDLDRVCDKHPSRFDCPDCLVHYSATKQRYGLIVHDGGSSSIAISYCPWCGTKLTA